MTSVTDNQRRAMANLGCCSGAATVLGMAAVTAAAKDGLGWGWMALLVGMWGFGLLMLGAMGQTVAKIAPSEPAPDAPAAPDSVPPFLADASSDARRALVALGIARSAAEAAVERARQDLGPNATAETLVKAALRLAT